MSETSGAQDGPRYDAEALGAEVTREAEESVRACRAEGDHAGAWRVTKERVGVLISLGLVETADLGSAVTFERIVRLAREADANE